MAAAGAPGGTPSESTQSSIALCLWASQEWLWCWNHDRDELVFRSFDQQLQIIERERVGWHRFLERVYAPDRELLLQAWENHLWRPDSPILDIEFRQRIEGEQRWFRMRGQATLRNEQGHGQEAAGTLRDIHDSKRDDKDLHLLAAAFHNTHAAMIVTDERWRVLQVNQAFSEITGISSDEARKLRNPETTILSGSAVRVREARDVVSREGYWSGEVDLDFGRKGAAKRFMVNISALFERGEEISHYVISFIDISHRHEYEQQLQFMANYDSLTRLPNRPNFLAQLQDEVESCQRNRTGFAVVFFDLDRFKQINDSLGHSSGDQLLCQIAERLRDHFRKSDCIARLGGDEFAFILTGLPTEGSQPGITRRISLLLELFEKPFVLQRREIIVTPSIGISLFPGDGQNVAELLQCADIAMYDAKQRGTRYQYYSSGLNDAALNRLELENDLRYAADRGELKLLYQPKMDCLSLQVAGAEVLLRWIHPERGFISPGDFIPIAEESGSVLPITEWIFEQVCQDLKSLPRPFDQGRIAVNLSARHFSYYDLPAFLDQLLARHGLPPEQLELEITEGILMTDMQATADILRVLRERGFTIAVDDFGTGFSSLSYLKKLPIDVLKVDRSFVSDITGEGSGAAIADTVVALAKSLDLRTVAEGVELEGEVQHLQSRGCNYFQGFYFHKPLPFEEFARLLASHEESDLES